MISYEIVIFHMNSYTNSYKFVRFRMNWYEFLKNIWFKNFQKQNFTFTYVYPKNIDQSFTITLFCKKIFWTKYFYTNRYTNSYEILRFRTKSYEFIRIHVDFWPSPGLYLNVYEDIIIIDSRNGIYEKRTIVNQSKKSRTWKANKTPSMSLQWIHFGGRK